MAPHQNWSCAEVFPSRHFPRRNCAHAKFSRALQSWAHLVSPNRITAPPAHARPRRRHVYPSTSPSTPPPHPLPSLLHALLEPRLPLPLPRHPGSRRCLLPDLPRRGRAACDVPCHPPQPPPALVVASVLSCLAPPLRARLCPPPPPTASASAHWPFLCIAHQMALCRCAPPPNDCTGRSGPPHATLASARSRVIRWSWVLLRPTQGAAGSY